MVAPEPRKVTLIFSTDAENAMTEKKKEPSSGPHCAHQGRISKNLHYSLYVVCQHVQAHLCTDALKPFGEEVRRPHPGFERAKRVLDRLPPDRHRIG